MLTPVLVGRQTQSSSCVNQNFYGPELGKRNVLLYFLCSPIQSFDASTSCEAKIKKEGAGTIPAKKPLELVRLLPKGEIKVKLLENHRVVC
jgi:hypothetical protein